MPSVRAVFDGEWWGHVALLATAAGSVLAPGLADAAARARRNGAAPERIPAPSESPATRDASSAG